MKLIQVPKAVKVKTRTPIGEREDEISFKEWATNCLDGYTDGVKTWKQVRQLQSIVDALENAGESLKLENADFDLLKAAADDNVKKVAPAFNRYVIPYYDAIEKAEDLTT